MRLVNPHTKVVVTVPSEKFAKTLMGMGYTEVDAEKPATLDAGGEEKPVKASKSMKTDDLKALAEELGVDISEATNNEKRAELINAATEAADDGGDGEE